MYQEGVQCGNVVELGEGLSTMGLPRIVFMQQLRVTHSYSEPISTIQKKAQVKPNNDHHRIMVNLMLMAILIHNNLKLLFHQLLSSVLLKSKYLNIYGQIYFFEQHLFDNFHVTLLVDSLKNL